ncbi:MAG TPA: NADPH-dependent assimilatory sulfite reductase hemoprotein subunit [Ktedonobacteraceae bacterium]
MAENQESTPDLIHLGVGVGSKVERIKKESDHLYGQIVEQLKQDTSRFTEDQVQLLKFHGTYQQEDRDVRQTRKAAGEEKAYQFMVRARIPGGYLTAEQYLAEDDIADRYANGTLRLTTRQSIQLHGILKGDLHAAIHEINLAQFSTLSACGDVNRNVMACSAPTASRAHARVHEIAQTIAIHLAPQTKAYHEIWIDGEKLETGAQEEEIVEPIYGRTYLPRKFKIGVAFPNDNCIDVYTQDIGLVAHLAGEQGSADERLEGFTVLIGGGMGMTHGKADTYPHLALPLCYATPEEVLEIVETIVTIQRDYGDRQNRKHARMKYVVAERGIPWFREQVESRLGRAVQDPRVLSWSEVEDHLGWHAQGDGRWFVGIYVENGRIKDLGEMRLRQGLHAVIDEFRPGIRLTPQQNILLIDIPEEQRLAVEAHLTEYGISTDPSKLGLRRLAMACPALPTCGQALAEAERVSPTLIAQIEAELHTLGLENEPLSIRMTGCPNGCARPYMGDIGLVGRTKDIYNIYIGGDQPNTRLNTLYASMVHFDKLAVTLHPLLEIWRDERQPGEKFGDFCQRVGIAYLQERTDQSHATSEAHTHD